jgi:hypothetical protein
MTGRMTYADENNYFTVRHFNWEKGSGNKLGLRIDTFDTQTGHPVAQQSYDSIADYSTISTTLYSPGILVPYNLISSHGSNFIRSAGSGQIGNEDTTPTNLTDLSSSVLQIGDDYMGTIKNFRIWTRRLLDHELQDYTT